jgi:hypothetical protein
MKEGGHWDSPGLNMARGTPRGDSSSAPPARHPLFQDALARARALNLRNQQEWRDWCRSGSQTAGGLLPLPHVPERVYKNSGWQGYNHWLTRPPVLDTPANKRRRVDDYRTPPQQRTGSAPVHQLFVCAVCSAKKSPRTVTHRSETVGDGTGEGALVATVEQRAAELQTAMRAAAAHDRAHPPRQGEQPVADYCLNFLVNSVDGLQRSGLHGRSAIKAPPAAAAVWGAFIRSVKERHAAAATPSTEPWRGMWPRPPMGPLQAGYLYRAFAQYHSSGDYQRKKTGGASDSKWMPKRRIIELCR